MEQTYEPMYKDLAAEVSRGHIIHELVKARTVIVNSSVRFS